ncbi:cold-regulated 413 plasma membrane protein 2-like [Impatiens glandulifera]|uniref:cold-regulated 413 plasma membrane protein 2-like n=1 Tax=Impatiens glandulifera TaxID=253017 RepID=UPI001FB1984E|nr:cold-regulated 413 plasma membrane protein 2-like [Impatiens glandulifera]
MVREMDYLAMKSDPQLIHSDINELIIVSKRLLNHAIELGNLGYVDTSTSLEWIASFAAIYLLILDRTNWRTNMLTSLLVPYIFLSLPVVLFNYFSGDFGKWVAFIAVVLRMFFPRHFPDWLEIPGSLVLLLVVAPNLFSYTLRYSIGSIVICLIIGCYLLQEHIKASGGFRNALTRSHGISNTLGIVLLLVYPVWVLVVSFV